MPEIEKPRDRKAATIPTSMRLNYVQTIHPRWSYDKQLDDCSQQIACHCSPSNDQG